MSRKSFGVALVLAGSPIIYFLRDGLGMAPANFYFTGIFMLLYLSFLFDFKSFTNFKLQKPNVVLFYLSIFFWAGSFMYFLYSNYQDKLKDTFYMLYLTLFFIGLLKLRYLEMRNLINSLFLVTLLSNLLFVVFFKFFFLEVSLRELGSRAYIGGEEGNPNLYANVAFYGVISSYFFLKNINKSKSIKYVLLPVLNILLSFIVIILSQNRTVMICLILLIGILFIKKMMTFFISLKFRMNLKSIFIYSFLISAFIVLVNIFMQDYREIYISNYAEYFSGLIENIKGGKGDMSSIQRIYSLNLVLNEISTEPLTYLIGKGYKYEWLDIPMLQSIRDMGLFGISFILFHFTVFFYMIKFLYLGNKLKNKLELSFLFSIYTLIFFNSLTHGQPYDLSHWLPFMVIVRFMKMRY